jgi:hypothetical protein
MEKLPQNYSRLLKYDCSTVHFHPDKDDHYPLEVSFFSFCFFSRLFLSHSFV